MPDPGVGQNWWQDSGWWEVLIGLAVLTGSAFSGFFAGLIAGTKRLFSVLERLTKLELNAVNDRAKQADFQSRTEATILSMNEGQREFMDHISREVTLLRVQLAGIPTAIQLDRNTDIILRAIQEKDGRN